MIMRQNIAVLITSLLLAFPLCGNATDYVSSPNGNVRVGFSLTADGTPTYTMSYKGKPVVRQSRLGLELAKDKHASKGMEETDLMDGFEEKKCSTSSFDETWKPVWGETSNIRNHYNEMEVRLY